MLDNRGGEQESSQQTDPLNVNGSKYENPVGTTHEGIAENKENNINIGFVFWHTVTIALGFA